MRDEAVRRKRITDQKVGRPGAHESRAPMGRGDQLGLGSEQGRPSKASLSGSEGKSKSRRDLHQIRVRLGRQPPSFSLY